MTDVLLVRARFGGCRVALARQPRPLFVAEHAVDGDGKKAPGFVPYVTVHWPGASVDVVAEFAEVTGFFYGAAWA